jgi:hypothetical protein
MPDEYPLAKILSTLHNEDMKIVKQRRSKRMCRKGHPHRKRISNAGSAGF